MAKIKAINVKPIYGWGWTLGGDKSRIDVPRPFTMEVVQTQSSLPKYWRGKVTSPGHVFSGSVVTLSQRHTVWDGHVNVIVDGEVDASGFALVDMCQS